MSRDGNPHLVLLSLWLMMFSASAQVIIMSPILPEIGRELGVGNEKLGILITSYTIFLGIFALVIGPVSDKIGRRIVLLLGCGLMAVALALHGVAFTYETMLGLRALAGVAGGVLSGAAVAYVGDYFPYEKRGWANGWVMSGLAAGQIIGIPIGKILASTLGFRWPFLMFAATMFVATLLVWFYVPQPAVSRDTSRLSVSGALSKYGKLIRQPSIAAASAVYFAMFLSLGLYVIYLPTWLESEVGLGPGQVASLFLVGGVANVITSPSAGKFSDRVGRKPLITASCLGFMSVMLVTTVFVRDVWTAHILFSVAMITVALRISPLQSLMTALVPDQERGTLMSLAISIGQIGMGAGSAFAGILYSRLGFFSNAATGALAVLLMTVLVVWALPEPEMQDDTAAVPS